MKDPQLSHCSDECLLSDIKSSKSAGEDSKGAELWDEETDPWN